MPVPAVGDVEKAARVGVVVRPYLARAALSHRVFTALQPRRLGALIDELIDELADAWTASEEARLHNRRGHGRMRAAGAGPRHTLVFTDRVITALVILRFQLPHAAPAVLYGVDRCRITRTDAQKAQVSTS
jgi:hypothetical protein